MRLDDTATELDDVASLLELPFQSTLPDEDVFAQAFANPSLQSLIEDKELGRSLTKNGVMCTRIVNGLSAINTGLPGETFGPFGDIVSSATADIASQRWERVAMGAVESGIDVGLKAIGAIPIVGWIADAALTIVKLLIANKKAEKPLPPMAEYSKGIDETVAQKAIDLVVSPTTGTSSDGGGADWTPLFMPIAEETSWYLAKVSGGWLGKGYAVNPREGITGSYLGTILGGYTGCQTINVPWVEDPDAPLQSQRDFARSIKGPDALWNSENVLNTYDTTPSVARLAQSAWVAATASKTAALFNIDPAPVARAWENFVNGALEAADKGVHSETDPRGETLGNRKIAWYALKWSMSVRSRGFGSANPNITLYDECLRHKKDLAQRQFSALDTALVAYCSRRQPAFRNQRLLEKLDARRDQLLSDPSRWQIRIDDIIDDEYRQRFALTMTRPITQRTSDIFLGHVPPAAPMPPLVGVPHEGRSLPVRSVAMLALGGLGAYYLAKRAKLI